MPARRYSTGGHRYVSLPGLVSGVISGKQITSQSGSFLAGAVMREPWRLCVKLPLRGYGFAVNLSVNLFFVNRRFGGNLTFGNRFFADNLSG